MNQLTFFLILFTLTYAFSLNQNLYELEGFGADMKLVIDSQMTVSSQLQFQKSVKSNIHIQLAPGSYHLTKNLFIMSLSNIILQGPATLFNFGVYVQKSQNIIIRNIRVLNASIYGIFVYHSVNVVIDHCTILDAGRSDIVKGKCIDITQQAKNVTVSYSILGFTYPIQQMLKYKGLLAANFLEGPVQNVSLHHNIFYCVFQRSPEISSPGLFDMRENIIFNYTEYGTRVRNGAMGNFIHNRYIGGKKDPLVFEEPLKIYSIDNTWKYNCSQQRKIDDIVHSPPYVTPPITTKDFSSISKEAGCLTRQTWQVRVSAEIKQHL